MTALHKAPLTLARVCQKTQSVKATHQQAGFTMIETIVSSLLLVAGILAFMTLQVKSLQSTQLAGEQTQAAILAGDIINSVTANLKGLEEGAYNQSFGKAADKITSPPSCSPCSPSELAGQDISWWIQRVEQEFNGASIELAYSAPDFSVRIEWPQAKTGRNDGAADLEPLSYETTIKICTQETAAGGAIAPCLI